MNESSNEQDQNKGDRSEGAAGKSEEERRRQAEQAKRKLGVERRNTNAHPINENETYGSLREENRVVMRHDIALNLETFRAAPDDFSPHVTREYPPLQPAPTPFFSIIVPNYNGRQYLPALMHALHEQNFADLEIIVVDDASTDDSVAWIEANCPDVRIVVNRQNEGFAAACNRGADVARGRVLVFLNNDTEPESAWTEELAKAICAEPDASIFASKLLLHDRRTVLHSAGDILGADGVPQNRGVWEEDRGQYDALRDVFGGCGGAAAYRRELWQSLGGFDESFWMYIEDADLAFRAHLLGARAVFVPGARVYHHLSATGGGPLASYYVGRNTIWLIVKNMPRSLLMRNLPGIAASQLRIAWDALRHWRGTAARARLRGQIAGLRQLGKALAQRRAIQPRRILDDRVLATRLKR